MNINKRFITKWACIITVSTPQLGKIPPHSGNWHSKWQSTGQAELGLVMPFILVYSSPDLFSLTAMTYNKSHNLESSLPWYITSLSHLWTHCFCLFLFSCFGTSKPIFCLHYFPIWHYPPHTLSFQSCVLFSYFTTFSIWAQCSRNYFFTSRQLHLSERKGLLPDSCINKISLLRNKFSMSIVFGF